MNRREFITLLFSAAAWPLAARAQQADRVRSIGVIVPLVEDDAFARAEISAFVAALQQAGWTDGHNARIQVRWAGPIPSDIRRNAAELVALRPDVVLAYGSSTVGPLLQNTRTVPIVFPVMGDPVAAGFVESLARPGGNITGFALYEFSISAKWLELLKRIAPHVTRAGIIRDPTLTAGTAMFGAIQAVAPSLGVDVRPIDVRDASEIERAVTAFARSSNGGLIVIPSPFAPLHRNLIVALAARHNLPTVYYERFLVSAGGLVSYGPDFFDEYRRAAGYINRVLKGEKPADLPVQAPTKYKTVINLKTAKALGLEIPPTVLTIADEVIE
jgi:putative ABC transport system substrate-binding protein